jgi:hypothetical protein
MLNKNNKKRKEVKNRNKNREKEEKMSNSPEKAQMDIINEFSNSNLPYHFHFTQYTLKPEKVLTESKLRNWLPRGELRYKKIIKEIKWCEKEMMFPVSR